MKNLVLGISGVIWRRGLPKLRSPRWTTIFAFNICIKGWGSWRVRFIWGRPNLRGRAHVPKAVSAMVCQVMRPPLLLHRPDPAICAEQSPEIYQWWYWVLDWLAQKHIRWGQKPDSQDNKQLIFAQVWSRQLFEALGSACLWSLRTMNSSDSLRSVLQGFDAPISDRLTNPMRVHLHFRFSWTFIRLPHFGGLLASPRAPSVSISCGSICSTALRPFQHVPERLCQTCSLLSSLKTSCGIDAWLSLNDLCQRGSNMSICVRKVIARTTPSWTEPKGGIYLWDYCPLFRALSCREMLDMLIQVHLPPTCGWVQVLSRFVWVTLAFQLQKLTASMFLEHDCWRRTYVMSFSTRHIRAS